MTAGQARPRTALREARVASGHSLQSLARELRLSRDTILDIELGRSNPSPLVVLLLSTALQAHPVALGLPDLPPPPVPRLARHMAGMSRSQLAGRSGVPPMAVRLLEEGTRKLDDETLAKLSTGLPEHARAYLRGELPKVGIRRPKPRATVWYPADGVDVCVLRPPAKVEVRRPPELPAVIAGAGPEAAYVFAASLRGFEIGSDAGNRAARRAWNGTAAEAAGLIRRTQVMRDGNALPETAQLTRTALGLQGLVFGGGDESDTTGGRTNPGTALRERYEQDVTAGFFSGWYHTMARRILRSAAEHPSGAGGLTQRELRSIASRMPMLRQNVLPASLEHDNGVALRIWRNTCAGRP